METCFNSVFQKNILSLVVIISKAFSKDKWLFKKSFNVRFYLVTISYRQRLNNGNIFKRYLLLRTFMLRPFYIKMFARIARICFLRKSFQIRFELRR